MQIQFLGGAIPERSYQGHPESSKINLTHGPLSQGGRSFSSLQTIGSFAVKMGQFKSVQSVGSCIAKCGMILTPFT